MLEQRERPVEVDLPPLPVWVDGDPVRLAQVLCNLLSNAAKFTAADGAIRLRITTLDRWTEITVADSGAGISSELLPHVFDLFVQGQQSIDRNTGGLGLGLAIVRMLAQMHGGTVSVSSAGAGDPRHRLAGDKRIKAGATRTAARNGAATAGLSPG